jgi:uncharacterized membrane protein YdfJ with MMPL/SSD domain
VLIFNRDIFDWLSSNIHPSGTVHAIFWLVPVMSFSILVGLSLDYDVFLFSRIVEYRKMGYPDRTSIVKGSLPSL